MIRRRDCLMGGAAMVLVASAGAARAQDRNGRFEGRSRHVTTGEVTLTGGDIRLGANFSLDRRVDPIVGLGRDGVWDPATYAGDLRELTGAQTYPLPAGINASDYNEVYIWCRAANVPLGVARLGAP